MDNFVQSRASAQSHQPKCHYHIFVILVTFFLPALVLGVPFMILHASIFFHVLYILVLLFYGVLCCRSLLFFFSYRLCSEITPAAFGLLSYWVVCFFSGCVWRVMLSEGLISFGLWWGCETTQVAASDAQTERGGPA